MPDLTFSVEMADLKKHINFVKNGLGSSKTDLPVMLLRFEVTGNKATIFAADKEEFTRTIMPVKRDVEDQPDGAFAVLGGKIERLISQVAAENVHFAADGENLEVQAGFLTVNFELYDGAVLKTVEAGVKEHLDMEGLTVNRSALEEALSCAKSCSTAESIRPDVNHAELRKGKMLSSDGRKIAIYQHDQFPEAVNLKVPGTVLTSVLSAVKAMDVENVQVIEGKSYYYLKGEKNKYTLGIRKVERNFPAVEDMITKLDTPTDEVSIDKNVFDAMIRGVALGLPSDEVKINLDLKGSGKTAHLEVSTLNTLNRRSHERAQCGRKAETDISIPVSFKHILDTLSVFKGDSVVDMAVNTARSFLLVRDTTDSREVLTAIPFRTDKQIEEERKEREAQNEAKKAAIKKEAEANKPDLKDDLDLEKVATTID